jgi:cell division protein FtsN
MTTSPRPASEPKGSSVLPFALGLTLGLVIAAAIAMFVTGAPVPFVDRGILSSQNSERLPTTAPIPRVQAPPPEPLVESAPTAKPSALAEGSKQDRPATAPVAGEPESPGGQAAQELKPQAAPASSAASQFFLQVAAFKSADEAEQMRVRLAFMGFEAHILETKKDETVFFRVRLGPYRNFEELNRAKSSLSQNGLEATVVRLNP